MRESFLCSAPAWPLKRDFCQLDARVNALCERQTAGVNRIQASLAGVKPVLTGRQREIALLMKDGLQAREIAEKLFITENTVKSAAKIIYEKLGVHSRVELTKIAF